MGQLFSVSVKKEAMAIKWLVKAVAKSQYCLKGTA